VAFNRAGSDNDEAKSNTYTRLLRYARNDGQTTSLRGTESRSNLMSLTGDCHNRALKFLSARSQGCLWLAPVF